VKPQFSRLLSTKMTINQSVPVLQLEDAHPEPVRKEFLGKKKVSTKDLEQMEISLGYHFQPQTVSDKIALRLVKLLRIPTDLFFKKKYVHRAVMLETVAGVPGMVAGMARHLTSLRTMRHDGGWIHHLLHEAENERMHLMTWMRLIKPTAFDRLLIVTTQGIFFNCYFVMYLFFPKMAHRFVGYLEEEAVVSYTAFLKEIDSGRIENGPAPDIAKWYWHLEDDSTVRDVVLAVRADEAAHRDVNHVLSNRLRDNNHDLRNHQDK
jgi:ubiquinol oxidase